MRLFGRGGQAKDSASSGEAPAATKGAGSKGDAKKPASRANAGLTRQQMLALKPLRNPLLVWEEREGRIILRVQHGKKGNWKLRLAHIFVPLPDERVVELDAIGSDVWNMLDGQHSVGEISRALAKKYKLENREAELSVQQYFKDLGRRGYIGFMEPAAPGDETPPR
jgi:hypothetical protein